jgi:phosphatidylserine synthase
MEAPRPLFFGRRIVPKPRWLGRVEALIGRAIPLHPNLVSALKLIVVLPLLLGLRQVGVLPNLPTVVLPLFALFLMMDYLDGVVARQQRKATAFGRVFDRLTDLPLLVPVALFACDALPCLPVALKLGLDLALLVLFCLGRGPVENRVRTTFSYTTLLILLLVSQGWPPFGHAASTRLAVTVLWLNVAFSLFVVVTRLNLLRPRYLADALSALNLLSGVASIAAALRMRFDLSLLFLLVGVVCDGLDGAAARRWGGSRFGVYSDDIADGVSYGLAPGAALVCGVPGVAGWALGVTYALLTISRLVYFTLRKGADDPDCFSGMPSPAGAVIALCALILFIGAPALVGLLVGSACVLMVAFDLRFRHPGRLIAAVVPSLPAWQQVASALGLVLVILVGGIVGFLLGPVIPAAALLVIALGYGLHVSARRLVSAASAKVSSRAHVGTSTCEEAHRQRS